MLETPPPAPRGRLPPSVGVALPPTVSPFRVDRTDDALAAEALRRVADHLGPFHRGRVEGDLVGPGPEKTPDVLDRPEAPAHGQRHVDPLGGPPDDVEDGLSALGRRGDVEEDPAVRPRPVVGPRRGHRGSRLPETDHAA